MRLCSSIFISFAISVIARARLVCLAFNPFSSSVILLNNSFRWVSKRSSTEVILRLQSCSYWPFCDSKQSTRPDSYSENCLCRSRVDCKLFYKELNQSKCKIYYLDFLAKLPDCAVLLVNFELERL